MPFCRSLMVNGSDSSRGRSSVTQYAVVCISFSGSSRLPAPMFSLVKNLIFLKPTTCERTRTSPWEKEEIQEVEEVKEVKDEEGADRLLPSLKLRSFPTRSEPSVASLRMTGLSEIGALACSGPACCATTEEAEAALGEVATISRTRTWV